MSKKKGATPCIDDEDLNAVSHAFKAQLEKSLDVFEKATENWPFPPGPEYRKAAAEHRKTQQKIVSSVQKEMESRKKKKQSS